MVVEGWQQTMKIFFGGLGTETNTFAALHTTQANFEEYGITRDGSRIGGSPLSGPLRVFRDCADTDGHELVETISAFAQPGGPTDRATYEALRDIILDDLGRAGACDVVLLMLHGAMVADGYDDCEGDLIARVRALAPNAVIGVELDPHCHLTDTMIANADLIIASREYPHVDFDERGGELYSLCVATVKGEIVPVAALIDCAMIGLYPTFDPPMAAITAMQGVVSPPLLSISIAHGFPWGDVAETGTRVLAYADQDIAAAERAVTEIAKALYDKRHALKIAYPNIAESLDRASTLSGRVVLGDFADNPGGGAPADSSFFLEAILERGLSDVAIGAFWDPATAQLCAEAGTGARLTVSLGGGYGPASGKRLTLEAEVLAVRTAHDTTTFGQRQPLGLSVWLRSAGIDILVSSVRSQVMEPDAFTGIGIDLDDKRLIVVKSGNHYRAGFAAVADHLWHVASPGPLQPNFADIAYVKRAGDFFPRVEDPWSRSGGPRMRTFGRLGRQNVAIERESQ